MHPRVDELVTFLNGSRETLRRAVDAVPEECRDARPAPERWSTAEVLDHLGKVEDSVARLLTTRIGDANASGLGPETETSTVIHAEVLDRLLDRTRTIEAAGAARPQGDVRWQDAWAVLTFRSAE